jgi:histidinol-phosphate phosphatase family protein
MKSSKFLFLDRDGIINSRPPEHNYVKSVSDLILNYPLFEVLARLHRAGIKFAVVSNQRGIKLGSIRFIELLKINDKIYKEAHKYDFEFEGIAYCTHLMEEKCFCRKPSPGLIQDFLLNLNLSVESCFLLGDEKTDAQAGRKAGINTIHYGCLDHECVCDFKLYDFKQLEALLK